MGMFSKLCVISNTPLVAAMSHPPLSHGVAIFPDDTVIKGDYDGYGRLGDVSLSHVGPNEDYDEERWASVKLMHAEHYTGQKYADLPECRDDPYQGHFYPWDNNDVEYAMKEKVFETPQDWIDTMEEEEGGCDDDDEYEMALAKWKQENPETPHKEGK